MRPTLRARCYAAGPSHFGENNLTGYIWLAILAVLLVYGVVIYHGLVNLKHAASHGV